MHEREALRSGKSEGIENLIVRTFAGPSYSMRFGTRSRSKSEMAVIGEWITNESPAGGRQERHLNDRFRL
jgi:hypothetical protein